MRKIPLILLAGFFLALIIRVTVIDYIIRTRGICVKAELIEETISTKYHSPSLKYSFVLENSVHTGNSLVEDLNQVGQKVCIVYCSWWPAFNWPIVYFHGRAHCNCK